jgi:hypothetical protein
MLETVWGSLLILLGVAVLVYTIYTIIASRPSSTVDWVFRSMYLLAGLAVIAYGYNTLYPPQPILFGGRRR